MSATTDFSVDADVYVVPSVKCVLFLSRSVNSEETEDVIERLLEDKSIDLQSIDSFSCAADQKNESEYEDCLKILPSANSNGFFFACVKPIKDDHESEVLQQESSDEEQVDEAAEKKVVVKIIRKKKLKKKNAQRKKKRNRRRSSYLNPTLSSKLKSASSLDKDFDVAAYSSRKSSQSEGAREESDMPLAKLSSANAVHSSKSLLVRRDSKTASQGPWRALTVFGTSLKSYFAGMVAEADGVQIEEGHVRRRSNWKYPVPNPVTWR